MREILGKRRRLLSLLSGLFPRERAGRGGPPAGRR
ncbi:hypothetical protein M2169_003097 [Streptomyces sp. MJP52]|nr:hypothetical protein [Streptomyces sp. MJP52]